MGFSSDLLVDPSRKIYSKPDFVEDLSQHGHISKILFSPFEWSQDVVLIAFENVIMLAHLSFEDKIVVNPLNKFTHPCRCTALSISPETTLDVLPNKILFCSAGNDFKLRIFSSDLKENNTCKVVSAHKNYINDVLYDPSNSYLSSASDDNKVKIWSAEDYSLQHTFNLTSPGVSLSWHRSEPFKLMVAEKIGLIKFFNVNMRVCIFSLDYGVPLSSAHWAPPESQLVASVHCGEVVLWDLTKKCFPVQTSMIFPEHGGNLKISANGSLIAAVNNLDGTLKIIHSRNNQVLLTASITLPTDVQWHYKYPVACIGDDSKLCFWKITV